MKEEILRKLINNLELPHNITFETKIEEIEDWDSLSIVSFGAMILTEYNVSLTAEEISKAICIDDLCNIVLAKYS